MAGDGAPSGATMVDAQMTITRVLKPPLDFERNYQGQPASVPIAFPGTRDPRAGTPGFSPDLMQGIPVPQGARVLLWLPICVSPVPPGNALAPFQFYSYRLIWRFQGLASYRNPAAKQRRAPYHFPRQSPGAPDTSLGAPGVPRVTIPASWHVVAYEQTEPAVGAGESKLRIEVITPTLDLITEFVQPLLPDGAAGVIQQGVLDPSPTVSGASANVPIFCPFWTDAEGDELIILANRFDWQDSGAPAWDFTDPNADLAFSNIYGRGAWSDPPDSGSHEPFRDVGIYMQTGTTP